MSIPEVAAAYWRTGEQGELLVGNQNISSIVARYGTPVFVYDASVIRQKLSALREALPERFSVSYSVKANPHPAFLRFFVKQECGLEIASAGECELAYESGCRPENVVFAGPGKTEEELDYVIARGIGEIHAESLLEIERIDAIGRKRGVRIGVAVRINPSEEVHGSAIRMGGKSAPFGLDEEELDSVVRCMAECRHIDFRGIHLFVGTQILESQSLLAQYKKGLEIFRRAAALVDFPLRTLDFGGGLGIRYFSGETELDLHALRVGLRELLSTLDYEECFAQARFMIEPGRFLVGEAGLYVARINDIKVSRGKKYLILDGGMNHHLAASGNLGQVLRRNFPIAILNKLDVPATDTFDVVGPLCTPLDTLARSLHLPSAEVGDLVGIFQSGAYARTASPLGFLSHPTPPEVWVENGQDLLIRRRGTCQDLLRDVSEFDTIRPRSNGIDHLVRY